MRPYNTRTDTQKERGRSTERQVSSRQKDRNRRQTNTLFNWRTSVYACFVKDCERPKLFLVNDSPEDRVRLEQLARPRAALPANFKKLYVSQTGATARNTRPTTGHWIEIVGSPLSSDQALLQVEFFERLCISHASVCLDYRAVLLCCVNQMRKTGTRVLVKIVVCMWEREREFVKRAHTQSTCNLL